MKNDETEKKPILVMKNLFFEKISFERDEKLPTEIRTKFSADYQTSTNSNEVTVKLTCNVRTDSKIYLDIVLVGIFENNETSEEIRDDITKINTVSIMFPYMRTELSLITAQPNFPTIDLPVVNIVEIIKEDVEMIAKLS